MGNVVEQKRRAFWLKHLHQWHWVSAAICLISMLLFSLTGITLNHAGQIAAKPTVTTLEEKLPAPLLARLESEADTAKAPLPAIVSDWIRDQMNLDTAGRVAEWSEEEAYVSMPRPGGDAWLSIQRESGEIHYERTDRGVISYLNDLHKGRNAGPMWGWFIDLFAVACVLFAGTGLFLLKMHSSRRPGTWPYVALGIVVPVVVIILFVH
ncbi:MAG: PepSY-associated TM helix domain-containing protein [Gammaproteobacteria bacterium]